MAKRVKSKELNLKNIDKAADTTVINELMKVKGIGPWTAEMFLMFALAREDVYSHGDLGLKKGLMKIYNFKKLPSQKQVEKITKKWSPYRTYACRILWQSLEI
ncbi:DNA-3-methyladenine glycosylase 2 family protein [Candidatus Roizmanbacteria bacterium]|nr:DNA-3-methyladenine glycosylase 2 family protein [Candidatus Roizmanbacteria bacterium]